MMTLHHHNYVWYHYRRMPNFILPSPWRSWVVDSGSLTKRLIQESQGDFRVNLLSNTMKCPTVDEAKLLGMKPRQVALIREVELICQNKTWVTARSIIPVTTLSGAERQLAHLGERPLGGFLFSAKTMQRAAFEFGRRQYSVDEHSKLPYQWARRSVFLLHEKPLLVSEYFEPALMSNLR